MKTDRIFRSIVKLTYRVDDLELELAGGFDPLTVDVVLVL